MSDPISREEAANVVRSIFRRCGYCIAEHGTRGRDLDLVAVPWTDRAGMPSIIVAEVIEALGGRMLGDPEQKPHGRAAYAIAPGHQRPHDMWYVDLSVVVPTEYRDEIMPRMEHVERAKETRSARGGRPGYEGFAETVRWTEAGPYNHTRTREGLPDVGHQTSD